MHFRQIALQTMGTSGIEICLCIIQSRGWKRRRHYPTDRTYLPVPVPLGNAISGNNGFGVGGVSNDMQKGD